MKAVYEAMAARLNADPAYSGPVAKTPNHPWWSTWEIHGAEYSLGELADYVDLVSTPPWSTNPNLDSVSHSRHCLLFEELRFYGYSIVNREREEGTFKSFRRLLKAYADSKNNYSRRGFSMNLSFAQVSATVKSVARWTWDRYFGCGHCNRGVMDLDKTMSLRERQRLAAKRTHQTRKNATESKIKSACRLMHKRGEKLTQIAVARVAGLSRQTVAKHQQTLNDFSDITASNVIQLLSISNELKNVNYAVHQISGQVRPLIDFSKTNEWVLFPRVKPPD